VCVRTVSLAIALDLDLFKIKNKFTVAIRSFVVGVHVVCFNDRDDHSTWGGDVTFSLFVACSCGLIVFPFSCSVSRDL
jgi:hypothetical protein